MKACEPLRIDDPDVLFWRSLSGQAVPDESRPPRLATGSRRGILQVEGSAHGQPDGSGPVFLALQ